MTVVVKHTKVCGGVHDSSKEVSKDDWNEAHVVEGLGSAAEASSADFEAAGAVEAHAAEDGAHAISGVTGLQTALDAKAASDHTHSYNDLTDKPSLFSGSYDDLTDTPSLFSGSYTDLSDKPTLGDSAAKNVGTASGTVAAGDHTHAGGGSALDAWPVGSVFIAVVSTSPATLLGGGTWAAFGAGRMLVGRDSGDTDFDTAEETGGAKTVTLTEAQIPGHVHGETAPTSASSGALKFAIDTNASGSQAAGLNTASTGGGEAHPNMPPYIVVYMWKRTA